MKYQSPGLFFLVAIVLVTGISVVLSKPPTFKPQSPGTSNHLQQCVSERDLSNTISTLSSGAYEEQNRAVASLVSIGRRTSACRIQVISSVMSAMDRADFDLTGGTGQFFFWHYGTQVLAKLKAVEALDLLIRNSQLNDGSGFPFNHYPALGGIIDIGETALPKLQFALAEQPDRFTRRLMVFCIAQIGGRQARQILEEAQAKEKDQCVATCIRASLTAFDNKRQPDHISADVLTDWYSTFLCDGK